MRLLLALAILSLTGGATAAAIKAGPTVLGRHHRLQVATPSSPLELASVTGAYGFRKLRAAYGGQAIRLRRASDNAQQDIGFSGSDFDTASATTFCNATSCFVAKWYDQSGAIRDFAQPTAGNQPTFFFGCSPGGGPCMRLTAAAHLLTAPSVTPAGSSVSFSSVTRRTAGTGACFMITETSLNNRFAFNNVSGSYFLAATGSMTALQTEGNWHSAVGVINGAASYIAVDATATTGTVTFNPTAAAPNINGAATTTCDEVEAVFWDNYSLSTAEWTALNTSQKAYWGF